MATVKLSDLLGALPRRDVLNPQAVAAVAADVTGVVQDSRQVEPGHVFVAIRGAETDGHRYIPDALRRGAIGVVVEDAGKLPPDVPGAVVPDGRAALARLAAAYHGYPSRKLRVIGVTGTDGKTTTSSLILAILQAAGRSAGAVTTVAASIAGRALDTGFHTTTPDSPAIQSYLAQMVEIGAEYAVIESTSQGLAQGRVAEVDYDVAVITNVTAEHLDYHKTFETYLAAKARLFEMLGTSYRKPGVPKVSVMNADDPSIETLRPLPADRHLTYGIAAAADVRAIDVALLPNAARFTAATPVGAFPVSLPLPGRYNVSNALAAIAVALSQEIPPEVIRRALAEFAGVPGRMDRIEAGQPFAVLVDFAHTPNSLDQALEVARGMTAGRVISVFGCAGLRDPHKRPEMGEIAGRRADLVVVTAEDPRTESLDAINAEIARGLEAAGRRAGEGYFVVPDREEAIGFALRQARPGDLVIITGKGHEQSMCFGTTEHPWSDHESVRRQLRQILAG